ncbi:MAG: ATP-binding protein [Actinomycetota bacterium]
MTRHAWTVAPVAPHNRSVIGPPSDPPTGTVTFLFTDIEGSTALLQRLGDDYRALIDDHNRLLREACREGYVSGTEGDAFFVVFRSAPAAVDAAVRAQRLLGDHGWPAGARVKVRMGLHSGEGALAGGEYAGIDVNRAARIAGAAHGGEILLSDATRALVEPVLADGLHLRDLGEHRLKDLDRPERLHRLRIEGLPDDFPPPRSLDVRPGNLPPDLTPFIGREQVLEDVRDLCRDHRLVTLTGPGGSGKTRLSLQLAHEALSVCPDGSYFVQLDPIVDPELVPDAIAKALKVVGEAGRPVLESIRDDLADKDVFLVLDNVEQVIDAAPIVPELLRAAPGLQVVATSREPLRVRGEQEYAVPPMAVVDPSNLPTPEELASCESVALFLDRARSIRPSFTLVSENARAVAEICARLDGLPLAIELAAARVRVLTPRQIADRLDAALPVLSGGGRDRPVRQQTLRDAIAWSYDLLDVPERTFFRRLAVFRGGCTLEAAERVCDPQGSSGADALQLLGSLVDKSLLQRAEREGEPRFELLYVIREFAKERLAEEDEESTIRRRHALFLIELLRVAAPKLFGADQSMWLDELDREHDNLRSAIPWAIHAGETSIALGLVSRCWRFWQMRGHLHEARERLDEVLAMPGVDALPAQHADALEAAGGIAYWMADWSTAAARYDDCLALRREIGDARPRAEAAYNLACIAVYGPGPFRSVERAEELLAEALTIFREQDDRLGLAKVLWATGGNVVDVRPADALEPFRESLAFYREVGDRFGEAWALHMLGLAEALTGSVDDAETHMRASLDLFLAADDRSALSILLNDFAVQATLRGDVERGLRLNGAAAVIEERSGVGLGVTATDIGGVLARMWTSLPSEQAQVFYEEGKAMTTDEALAYAMDPEG